jgi:hypothetical protein
MNLPTTFTLRSVVISFMVGFGLSLLLATALSSYAFKLILAADDDLFEGKTPYYSYQSYQTARRIWPVLYLHPQIDKRIDFFKTTIEYQKSLPNLTVFFNSDVSDKEISAFIESVQTMAEVQSLSYVSKYDAYEAYVRQADPAILELISPDLLPASLEIYLNDLSQAESVRQRLLDNTIVEEVSIWNLENRQ